ncbi:MAG: nuclear transport factor 2 family protein [Myxococcales bacterium]|nr:nuclear transport factor 2 family protein [Myxococcales bacterium]
MAAVARKELEEAFAAYNQARDEASRTGDWSVWAARFTPDAHYVEHAYGDLDGREAIREWITNVMAPYPKMTFPQDWVAIDEAAGAIVFQCQNNFPEPFQDDGTPFGFPTWTRLVYGGEGLWREEEDMYNPVRDAPRVFKAWITAGGKPLTSEQVLMKHR